MYICITLFNYKNKKHMKNLLDLPNPNRKPLTSDEILNLAPESLSESLLLKELVRVLKAEIKEKLISDISHQLR